METFEFLVTSIARVALKEHVKIQAELRKHRGYNGLGRYC